MEGGFSIREYASRMRSINVVNCWPFDETSGEEAVKSLLPPITVKKFTWWLDELEYIHSESATNFVNRKKKKREKGETSSRNEDQDSASEIEGIRAAKMKSLKGKMKAQKKRSIVELFAAAPPVERVFSEEEDEEEEDSAEEDARDMKTKLTKKNSLRAVKKIKKNNKKKENLSKLKLQAQDKATGDPSSSYSKDFEHNIRDCVPILKRKPSVQHLDAYKRIMPSEAFNLIEENQHQDLRVHGILKNQGEPFPPQQSMKCILQEAVHTNDCGTKKANKHVTFSKRDEILRLSRKPSNSLECYNFQNICGSDKANAGGVGKDSTVVESSGSEDDSSGVEKEVEQLITCIVDSTSNHTKKYEEEPSRRPEATDRSSLHHANQDWSCNVSAPGYFCSAMDGYYNNPNIQLLRNSSSSIFRRLDKDLRTPGQISSVPCFEDCRRPYNEPSMSDLPNMERRKHTSLESTAINSAHAFQFQTFPQFSPSEGSHTGNVCGRRGTTGVNEDFVGLPLNSRGEMITLNPSGKREVNQMMNSSFSSEWRSVDCRVSSTDQLNLFPVESYAKQNPIAVIPSRLGITESENERRTNSDLDLPEMNYHSLHDLENIMLRGDSQVQKSHENDKIQSTMRLMGKEFTVGGKGVQGFEDKHIWKDKQIINELHFGNDFTRNIVHDQNKPSSQNLREISYFPSEVTFNHRSERKYAVPRFDHQTSSMYPSVFVARKVDPVQKMYPAISPGSYSEVYSNESLFSQPFTSAYESPFFTHGLPTPRSAHQEACPNMNPSLMQPKSKQDLPHSPVSGIRFPFMHPDLDGHSVSSWSRRSSVNQSPMVFDVAKKATQLSNSQSYCNGTDSPTRLKPDGSRMFFPLSSRSAPQTSVAPMPYYPGILMQKRHGNPIKFKEQIKSRIGNRVLDNGKKLKGQLSPLSTVPFKPLKMPTFRSHGNIQCASTKPTSRLSFNCMEDAFESCSATNKSKSVMCGEHKANMEERIIFPCPDSNNDPARTGPLKLTGGAKHILKACQQKDQSSSMSADQETFRFSESDDSAKLYGLSGGKAPQFEL